MKVSAEITIEGRVQGVGYRWYAQEAARELHLQGTVQNLCNGNVLIHVEGERELIEQFISALQTGPALARVSAVHIHWEEYRGHFTDFRIII